MKKLLVLSIITLITLSGYSQEKDYSLARVGKKIQGVYIFFDTQPYQEYDFIATIKVTDNWTFKTREEAFEKIIRKAKKKHPYFNGIIFSGNDLHKADIIKFRGLENSGGGLRVGDKVVYRSGKIPSYGEIISLDNTKQKATFKYLNIYGEEKVEEKKYTQLSPLSDEQYLKFSEEHKKEIEKYKYKIGEKATWIIKDDSFFGEIKSLNNKAHKASIEYINIYGEIKIKSIEYLDIEIISDVDFSKKTSDWKNEIKKYKFQTGDKVSWIKTDALGQNPKQITGDLIELNDSSHKATVKYLDKNKEEKIAKVSYLDLSKIIE